MSETRTFTITKEAAKAVGVGGTRRKRKAISKQKGPLSEEDFSMIQKAPIHIQKHGGSPSIPIPIPATPAAPSTPATPAAPSTPATPTTPATTAAPSVTVSRSIAQGGGPHEQEKNVRVELKKKTEAKSVHLRPKSDAPKKAQTKRRSKLTLGISSLRKRITRAKHIHRNVKNMPLDKLKEELIKKNLIRPTSKAPESVLRQIARDSQMVATSM